ncbi:hypothetical protein [Streptomyces sp. NRRL F-2664]|uniref:hypothetical protein n=1 Tax=Streptomyces sp. NRRL F-2664 TaxID=1463842 RepID=UPI000ABCB2E1|nr:hypothetical protein [Streptomyces sp. NRRL F-2664]
MVDAVATQLVPHNRLELAVVETVHAVKVPMLWSAPPRSGEQSGLDEQQHDRTTPWASAPTAMMAGPWRSSQCWA